MTKRFSTLAAAFAVLSPVFFGAPGFAANQNTATLTVNGSVTQSCTAFTPASNTLTFPAYDSFNNASTADDAGPVSFTTKCTKGASGVSFQVDGGLNYAHTSGTRAMKSGSANDYLNYSLYSDSGRTTAWAFNASTGAGTPAPALTIQSSNDTQTLTIYGSIPAGQDPTTAIDYSDTVTVAVNF
jgi:spore coat protein U-like protein